jgi:L-malate glycosyltransferase
MFFFAAKHQFNNMTIAIVSMIRDSWGGSEELWYKMAETALDKGYTVIHLRYQNPDVHPKMRELVKRGLISYSRSGWVPQNATERRRLIYITKNFIRKKIKNPFTQIFKHNPDILLYNGTCYSIAREKQLLAKLNNSGIKFFIIGHLNSDFMREISDRDASIIKYAYRQCKKVFFVSKRNYNTAKRHLCTEIPNFQIIRNPVNMASVDLIPFPSTEQIISFALVGNLVTKHKGQDLLLEVLSNEKWKNRDWILNIYGDGTDKFYLEELCNYLGLQKKVVFHNSVADIRKLWKENHVLIMPSLMEGMPLAVVEAMLCGRVCIVTDVGGNSEWIDDNINGFIALAPTVHCLEQTIEKAWRKKDEWSNIGRMAHEKAAKLYNPNAGKELLKELCEYD